METHLRRHRAVGLREGLLLGLWFLGVTSLGLPSAVSPAEPPPRGISAMKPAGSLVIPAYAYDRGNPKTYCPGEAYADAEPMVTWGGQYPVVVEYDFESPVTARYTLWIYYAAAEARPAELFLDGKPLGPCCRTATGSWNTSGARWEETCKPVLEKGRHTVVLRRNAPFPHLVCLRFDSPIAFPQGWKLLRPGAKKLTGTLADIAHVPSPAAIRLAIRDLTETFGARYPRGAEYLKRLDALEQRLKTAGGTTDEARDELARLQRESLLDNPLLDFDELLLVQRGEKSPQLGLPRNWQSNSSLPKTGYDDSIAILTPVRPDGRLSTLYRPSGGRFTGDVDLNFDADRLLFSMPADNGHWQVFEIHGDGSNLRQLTGEQPDVDSYDACYLPSGKIVFTSTACFQAVPCTGSDEIAVLYVMDGDGRNIRQLAFDQDHDWCPTVLNSGRVLYTRWEYTDQVHCHARRLFHMNPDGTEQMAYLGSNSYWPNATFYARPIPGHPTKVVAVISGHHGQPRMGELVIFDPAKGRHEAEPAIQRIPGYGKKVERVMKDQLADASWPKFLHPYPLSEKYFLVAAKPTPRSLWGIYLADVFDNVVLVKELPGYALLEPVPLRKTPRPPLVPEKVDVARKDATVYISDIYAGKGLAGIPRGTVKSLRVFSYHFAYRGMVTNPNTIGINGPWDIKRVLGKVPVCADGSAKFRIPANTPVSIQPLDAEGKALQLMRNWLTAMPGETVQCTGCHEPQNTAPPGRLRTALDRPAEDIRPWYGAVRGFSYRREVQPVIDRYCVGCHDGKNRADGIQVPNLRGDANVTDYDSVLPWQKGPYYGKFSVGYAELVRFVRRPGAESDLDLLEPMEFHADTTELVQMLKKGHYGVQLDGEAWDRLVTWIDLNCPFHGTRHEELQDPGAQRQRRRELLNRYAGRDDDPEALPGVGTGLYNSGKRLEPIVSKPPETKPGLITCPGWPFDAAEAARRQQAAGPATRQTIELGGGEKIHMALIPPGTFVMGSTRGEADERPLARVRIQDPFWLSACEITNRHYNLFDSTHDSRVESKNATQYGIQGYPVNLAEQPVVRVSWQEAMAFCRWLSEKTGRRFSLPTEAQWEFACRAGTETPFFYGDLNSDFSRFANLADAKLVEFASDVWNNNLPLKDPSRYDEWLPKDARFNDGALVSVPPARYQPNPWGLFDIHGNVAEWTRTTYRPYPYDPGDGRDDAACDGRKVVRGGSWRDRPRRSTASFRLSYQAYQRVFNVGFRVACESLLAAPGQGLRGPADGRGDVSR
ncbi:MAG: SUMF1/EgtB/PvdO family nonheme iron enzyme [Thermoguttaceae bacterium]